MGYKFLKKEYSGIFAILLAPVAVVIVVLTIPFALLAGIWCKIFPWEMTKEELLVYLNSFVNGEPGTDEYYEMYDQFMCGGPIRKGPIAEIVFRIRGFTDSAKTDEGTYFSKEQLEKIKLIIEEVKASKIE